MTKLQKTILAVFLILFASAKVMGKPIIKTKDGLTVIDIEKPNNDGVSINDLYEFNVEDKGTVLNNSKSDYITSQGTKIDKNKNLDDREADIALLRVLSSRKSVLKGLLEAAGDKELKVYLSNQNGIIIDGLTFENISKAVLTTGSLNDNLNITVRQGEIKVTNKGVKGSKFIDLLTVKLINEGKIAATDEVRVTIGDKNNIKVDASDLGSIYSNKISVKSSDPFLLVNAKEIMAKDKVEIDIKGKLKNTGTIAAKEKVSIKAGSVLNEGKVDFKNGGYELKWITEDGKVFSYEDIQKLWIKKYHKELDPTNTFLANTGKTLSGFVYDVEFTKANVKKGSSLHDQFNNILDELEKEDKYTVLSKKQREDLRNKQINSGFVNFGDYYATEANGKKILEAFAISKTKADQAKIYANNVDIETINTVTNKDGLIKANNNLKIKAKDFENKNSLSDEIELKDGYEKYEWKLKTHKPGNSYDEYVKSYNIDYERGLRQDSDTRKTRITAINKSLISGKNIELDIEKGTKFTDEINTGKAIQAENLKIKTNNLEFNGQNVDAKKINIEAKNVEIKDAGLYTDEIDLKSNSLKMLSKKGKETVFNIGKEKMTKDFILGSLIKATNKANINANNLELKGAIIQSDGDILLKGNNLHLNGEIIERKYDADYDIKESFRKIRNHERVEQVVGSFISGKKVNIDYKSTNTKGSGLLGTDVKINSNKADINVTNVKRELDKRIGVDNGILGINYNKMKKQENMSVGSIILSKGDIEAKINEEFNITGSRVKGKKVNIEAEKVNINGKLDETTTDTEKRNLLGEGLEGSYTENKGKDDITAKVDMEIYKKEKTHKKEQSVNKSIIEGDDISIKAKGNVKVEGSNIDGKEKVKIKGKNVEITSKETEINKETESETHKVSVEVGAKIEKNGNAVESNNKYEVEHKNTKTKITKQNGSSVKGKNIEIEAENKAKIKGSKVEGKEKVSIKGKNGVDIEASKETQKQTTAIQKVKVELNAKLKDQTFGIIGTIKHLFDERNDMTKYIMNIPGAIKKYKDIKKEFKQNTEKIKNVVQQIKDKGVDPKTLGINLDLDGGISYNPQYIIEIYEGVVPSEIRAKEVEISSDKDVNIVSSKVEGDKVKVKSENLNVESGKNTESIHKVEGETKVTGKYNIIDGNTTAGISANAKVEGKKEEKNIDTGIKAKEIDINVDKDVNIKGGNIKADKGNATIGKNLNIENKTDKNTEYKTEVKGNFDPNTNKGTIGANAKVEYSSKKKESGIDLGEGNVTVKGKKTIKSEAEINVKVNGKLQTNGDKVDGTIGASTKFDKKGNKVSGKGELGLNISNDKVEGTANGEVTIKGNGIIGDTTIGASGTTNGKEFNTNVSGNTSINLDKDHVKGKIELGAQGNLSKDSKGKIDANWNANAKGHAEIEGNKGIVSGKVTLNGETNISGGKGKETVSNVKADGKGHVTVKGETENIKGNVTIGAEGTFEADNKKGVTKAEGNANAKGHAEIEGNKGIVSGKVTLNGETNISGGKGKETISNVKADGKGHVTVKGETENIKGNVTIGAEGTFEADNKKGVTKKDVNAKGKGEVELKKDKKPQPKPKKLKDKVDMKDIRSKVLRNFRRRTGRR